MTSRSRTIAIVGAGFSGAALAYRLLRRPAQTPVRIVLIERARRFGCGLAYSERASGTTLNVPASRMSIDEDRPNDLLDYLRARDLAVDAEEFIPRTLYGDYVETRLLEAARGASRRVQLTRVNGTVAAVTRRSADPFWSVQLDDGSSALADSVVLALGHFSPRPLAALEALAVRGCYENDPWSSQRINTPADRVLLIGTGLTMADVACKLACNAHPPREIVAMSRRGLLALSRREVAPVAPSQALGFEQLERQVTLRGMIAQARQLTAKADELGIDWRDVMVALRERVPRLWHRLNLNDKLRFLRHVQPYWDAHRHQLPPLVGRTVHELIRAGRLSIRAGRVIDARWVDGKVAVTFRPRGRAAVESQTFDRIINCSGSDADPGRVDSALVRSLLETGRAIPHPTGVGFVVDSSGRLIGADGVASAGLHYLGPWLRARDLECTAVHELRQQATALSALLLPTDALSHRAVADASPDAPAARDRRRARDDRGTVFLAAAPAGVACTEVRTGRP